MAARNQHVVPRPEGWAVRGAGNTRDTSHHQTQAEAIEAARRIARNNAVEVVIHGRDGGIRDSDSYGSDPNPPPDRVHGHATLRLDSMETQMEPMWMLVGLMLGAACAGAAMRSRLRALRHELDSHRLQAVGDLKADVARLEAELKGAEAQVATLQEVRDGMLAQVGEKVASVFADSGRSLVDLAKSEMQTITTQAQADFEQRGKAVTDMVAPVNQTLSEMRDAMSKLDRERTRTFAELTQKLSAVSDGQSALRSETSALSRALRQPHTRGQWGEYHLRRAVEMAGMMLHCDFDLQVHVEINGQTLRPDMVVKLPDGGRVPVDAKAPIEPYLNACEASDDAQRSAYMELFARGMRAHVKKLADKRYFDAFNSPEFVVMYVPGEQFLGAALEVDAALLEDAFRQRVIIATPTTLIALLWSVACGWQQAKLADEAREIARLGRELHSRLATLLGHVDLVTKRLNSVQEAQAKVVGSLERRVLPAAGRFPELGVVDASNELNLKHHPSGHAPDIPRQLPPATLAPDDDLDAASGDNPGYGLPDEPGQQAA